MPYLLPGLFLFALLLTTLSGVFRRYRYSVLSLGCGCAIIFGCSIMGLLGKDWFIELPLRLPGGNTALKMDAIAAWFLMPLSVIPPILCIYGVEYWEKTHTGSAVKLRFLLGLASASLLLIPIAAHAVLFVMAWELLAIAGFLMVVTEDKTERVRQAGWVYLAAGHTGVLCLIAAFGIMATASGNGLLATLPAGWVHTGAGSACFLLLLAGFALKAGLGPFHIWLPEAHGAAPSHVSAFLSGLAVKMGILGFFRLLLWTPDPPLWWAGCLLTLGTLSAVLGAASAAVQREYKHLLAYSTVENMGIITIALSLAFAGKALDQPVLMALGMAGALVHVLNHSLLKTLLFLCAGYILHTTGTRDIERLGGLAKQMPGIAAAFLFGAIALCGLPPLCGFIGEWLILLGIFESLVHTVWIWAIVALVALLLAGGFAMVAFSKIYGMAFLGEPRSDSAVDISKTSKTLEKTIYILLSMVVLISVMPAALAPVIQSVLNQTVNAPPDLLDIAPLGSLGLLACLILIIAIFLWSKARKTTIRKQPTWDCGYAATSPRIQYTASSFAQMTMDFFQGALRPKKYIPKISGLFPKPSRFDSETPDLVINHGINPAFRGTAWLLAWLRVAQGGLLPVYLLYVVIALLALLAWTLA